MSARHLWVLPLALLVGCKPAPPPEPAPQTVVALTIAPRPAAQTAEYVGTAEAVEEVEIRSRVSGLIERRVATEGQRVQKGQPLFQIDRQPFLDALQQAQAQVATARAAQEQVLHDYARAHKLFQSDVLSQADFDAVTARRDSAAAAMKAAEASVSTAQLNLGYTRVESPIDGVMGRALLKDGALVTAYTSLLTSVYATDPMHVNIALSEADVLALEKQLGRRLEPSTATPLPARLLLSDGSEFPSPAHLDFVAPQVDSNSGTLAVRLRVANVKGALRAGQFVRVVLTLRQVNDALFVPQRAVQDLQGKKYVWVVDAEHKAQQRDVTPGPLLGGDLWIAQGLSAGDVVVTDGAQRLKPGAPVQIKEPAAAAPPTASAAPKP